MSKIKQVRAREILDSRGLPTVECMVSLSDGILTTSSVSSGSSRGTYEALELRDGENTRFQGFGVRKAVENVNNIIAAKVEGMDVTKQQEIDRVMIGLDGTQNKGRLGANAILAVSQAVFAAAARSSSLPLFLYTMQFLSSKPDKKTPMPIFNIIEGGGHAFGSIDFQDVLIIPASSKTYSEALQIGGDIYQFTKKVLAEKGLNFLTAEEGGFALDNYNNEQALALVKNVIDLSGYSFGLDVFMGCDVGANHFKDGKLYKIRDNSSPYDLDNFISFYENLSSQFSLIYLEDPFAEDDWEGWKKIKTNLSDKLLLVGDDLTVTNPYRLQLALDNNVIGGIVIKPNQIGTITETIAVVEMAKYKNLKIIVSGRSGETMDDFMADFAVGLGADYVRFGSPARERTLKYNRLLQIEEDIKML